VTLETETGIRCCKKEVPAHSLLGRFEEEAHLFLLYLNKKIRISKEITINLNKTKIDSTIRNVDRTAVGILDTKSFQAKDCQKQ
jgi:hypothetical protein